MKKRVQEKKTPGEEITQKNRDPAIPTAGQANTDEKAKLVQLIQALEQARGTRVIAYWTADMARISEASIICLYDQLENLGKQESLDLFLYSRGGDTEAPWRIVTLIREYCKRFSVLVPYRAYSAGTLLAMGADEIVMTPLGVLGPIDPSRSHPLLPRREGAAEAEPTSVQDMRHAVRFIQETAKPSDSAPYTPDAMAQIVTALFDKIHPLAIGAIEQSYALAKLIGTQCLGTHMNPDTEKDQIKTIVDKLCDDYKSHAYQINRREAKAIGLKVVDAQAAVDKAMINLLKFYVGRNSGIPAKPQAGQNIKMYIAWLDSTGLQLRVEADYAVDKTNQMKLLADRWVPY